MSHVKPGEETHMPAYPLGEPLAEQEKLEHQLPEQPDAKVEETKDEPEAEDTEGASAEQRPPADS